MHVLGVSAIIALTLQSWSTYKAVLSDSPPKLRVVSIVYPRYDRTGDICTVAKRNLRKPFVENRIRYFVRAKYK